MRLAVEAQPLLRQTPVQVDRELRDPQDRTVAAEQTVLDAVGRAQGDASREAEIAVEPPS